MMTDLKEKQTRWLNKLMEGDEHIMAITRCEKEWYLVSKHHSNKIQSMLIMSDDGNGFQPDYCYFSSDGDTSDLNSTIVVKNEKKLIYNVNEKFFSCGGEKIDPAGKSLIIYVRTERYHVWIYAHKDAPSVTVTMDMVLGSGNATNLCMDLLISSMKAKLSLSEGHADD